ncbi:hypothetical protein GCM10010484_32630 [Actinokineospora globicatena]
MGSRSGNGAGAVDDDLLAESHLVRALAVADARAVLADLVDLFSRGAQWHRALDAAFELLSEVRRRGEPAGETLLLIGEIMLRASRFPAAVIYLDRAEQALGSRLDLAVALARAHQGMGSAGPARRHLHRALAMAVDVDDDAAAHVRALLRSTG